MQLYLTTWSEQEPSAQNCEWFTNKSKAEAAARAAGGFVRPVDFPTDAASLLAFLNTRVWRA